MPIIVSMKPYWNVEVGGVACESSSLSVADTANVGVAWEASLPNIADATAVNAGNVQEKNYLKKIKFFFNNIPSIVVVVSNQNNENTLNEMHGARRFGIIIF